MSEVQPKTPVLRGTTHQGRAAQRRKRLSPPPRPKRPPRAEGERLTRIEEYDEKPRAAWLDMRATALEPAHGRIGPYELVCRIASGGMATVYLGVRRGFGGFEKFVAIKKIHPDFAGNTAFANMFMDEARITAMIAHPHVCGVSDFGRDGDDLYIVMEFLQGVPLSAITREHARRLRLFQEPLRPQLLARLFADFAEGVNAIHSLTDEQGKALGVIHRDITPHNLFVLFDGTVRVTDLGIAYARDKLHRTAEGELKGKLSYMAPEQLQRVPADSRSDIWSLGVVMWEALTGHRLFRSSSEADTVVAVLRRDIPPPSSLDAQIPKALDEIVLKALARNRDDRYQTMAELARALERFLASSGDVQTSADVARWVARVLPHGPTQAQQLMLRARQITAERAPNSADSPVAPSELEPQKTSEPQKTLEAQLLPIEVVPHVCPQPRKRLRGYFSTAVITLGLGLLIGSGMTLRFPEEVTNVRTEVMSSVDLITSRLRSEH